MHQVTSTDHNPVLLSEVLKYLDPQLGDSYLDVTAGYGGHAKAVLAKTQAKAILIDRDQEAIDNLQGQFDSAVEIIHSDYLTASQNLLESGQKFDLILADLGVSSPHFNKASRGFSFKAGPLDMRMDQTQKFTADQIVNRYSETELSKLLHSYGEEPKANAIARAIVQARPIDSTDKLASVIAGVKPKRQPKVHPATQTFQALRIAVNDELRQLKEALPIWLKLLKDGGRIVVISFHSLEDRAVKQALAEAGGKDYEAVLRLLTKHPVTASRPELVFNPRARSAKLRAAAKIKIYSPENSK